MRTKLKPENFEDGLWYEKECTFIDCVKPKFYTDNNAAIHCCNSHRFKMHQLKHKNKNNFLKAHAKKFKKNSEALKWLFFIKIIKPTERDLLIAGFDLNVRNAEIKKGNESWFKYFDYVFIIKPDSTYEIILNNN